MSAIWTVLRRACLNARGSSYTPPIESTAAAKLSAVVCDEVYCDVKGHVMRALEEEFPELGGNAFFFKPGDTAHCLEQVRAATLAGTLAFVFAESVSNPSARACDWAAVGDALPLATPFILDNTWFTGVGWNPFAHIPRVTAVVESCSKYLSGGRCIAGVAHIRSSEPEIGRRRGAGGAVKDAPIPAHESPSSAKDTSVGVGRDGTAGAGAGASASASADVRARADALSLRGVESDAHRHGLHVSPLYHRALVDADATLEARLASARRRTDALVEALEGAGDFVGQVCHPASSRTPPTGFMPEALHPAVVWFCVRPDAVDGRTAIPKKKWRKHALGAACRDAGVPLATSYGKEYDLVDSWPEVRGREFWVRISVGYDESVSTDAAMAFVAALMTHTTKPLDAPR